MARHLFIRPELPFRPASLAAVDSGMSESSLCDSRGGEMAVTHEQARRQAEASIDAFNRRDPEPIVDMLHDEVAHGGPFVADHVGHEHGPIEGKEAQRAFLRWLWAKEPALRHVLEDVFVGSEGFAFVTHGEHDGTRYVFVSQVDADGRVRNLHVYHGSPPTP